MSGLTIPIAPLSAAGFAAFGDVIESEGRGHYPIGGRPLISLCRAQPVSLPLRLLLMERHPLSSQAFIPLSRAPFLVVVAPAGQELRSEGICAFRSNGHQGVNYRAGTWHHPLLALDEVTEFLVVDRGGEGANCDEISIAEREIVISL